MNSNPKAGHFSSRTVFRVLGIVTAAVLAVALLDVVLAQAAPSAVGASQQQEPASTDDVIEEDPTPVAPIGLLSPTVATTDTVGVTVTVPISGSDAQDDGGEQALPADDSGVIAVDQPETIKAASSASKTQQAAALASSEPLSGTIVSNRTNYGARFFLEGQVYRLDPFASSGLVLSRDTAVLTLFSCDAETPETQEDCFWDPYLLQRDDFYEIVDESSVVGLPSLMIQNADAPPEDQVWIHNRTGITESVVFREIVHDVAPGAVHEFDVEVGAPVIVYVRSCAAMEDEQVCEWAPANLDTGAYFAMVEVSTPGGVPGSRITTVDLRPVLDAGGEVLAAPASVICDLLVPALNIRSGPGLQYQIVGKIRAAANEPANISVTARSADDLWFTVAESLAESGWVTSNPDFMACRSGTDDLPIAEFTGAPLAPAPVAAATSVPQEPAIAQQPSAEASLPAAEPAQQPAVEVSQPPPAEQDPAVEAADVVTPTEEAPTPGIPEGLAMLVVNNGFQHPIRFTVDQRYRPIEGPSEFDLEPGASTSVIVFPGNVPFTASSPWNGLSGNNGLEIGADQSAVLWLRFEPEPDDSSQWYLAWE